MNRAAGASTEVPALVYGPNHRDHSLPGSSVFPLRKKNSSLGSLLFPFACLLEAGGPHHSIRPHCENSFASNDCDSKLPSGSYSGPNEKTLPGFAVHRKTLPPDAREIPVICAEPDFASCAYTPRPSITSSEPVFPVPASKRPSEFSPSEYTTSSRELQISSGAPSGEIR